MSLNHLSAFSKVQSLELYSHSDFIFMTNSNYAEYRCTNSCVYNAGMTESGLMWRLNLNMSAVDGTIPLDVTGNSSGKIHFCCHHTFSAEDDGVQVPFRSPFILLKVGALFPWSSRCDISVK